MTELRLPRILALVLAAVLGTVRPAVAADGRPNVLFLLADDWAWSHASCLGDPVVRTPTFDRVVREGVLFRHAHAAAPSCSPSRAAMLTGQWPARLDEGADLRGSLPTRFAVYPDRLAKAGYHVGSTGKGYAPGLIPGWPHNPAGTAYADFAAFLAHRPAGAPFCYWFGSHHPHRPYAPGCGIRSGMDPAKVVVPPYLPDSPAVRSDICDYYFNVQVYDRDECGPILAALDKSGELDHTIVVMAGDNGWPFPRAKATNYDTGTHQALAVRWPGHVRPGRTVDDFVSLADLAPTFLEAAGVAVPADLTGRSLMPQLTAESSGQIDPQRDHVLTLMETHAACRPLPGGNWGGYPRRSILNRQYHYIRNVHPDRWPAGEANGSDRPGAAPFTFEQLARRTELAFGDIDAGPAKAFLVVHRDDPAVKSLAERVLGRRPARELYDLAHDPDEMTNVADDPAYAPHVARLDAQLTAELRTLADPRATGDDPDRFDRYTRRPRPAGGE